MISRTARNLRAAANDTAGEEVEHDGEVEPALRRPDVGDIRPPLLVRAVRREVLRHKVRGYRPSMFAVRRALEAPLLSRDQLVLAHQPSRAVSPDLMAFIYEIAVHAGADTETRNFDGSAVFHGETEVPLLGLD
jgi:hypothetical protein